ncbi:unnamed protein product, partial [Microthlaspi erraticum]
MENIMKYRLELDRALDRAGSTMRKDMLALNSKLDKLILAQFPAKHVNYVSGKALVKDQEGEENQHEVCYIQNRQGGFRNPQQGYTIGYGQQGTYSTYPNTLPNNTPVYHQGFTQWPNHTQPSQDWDMKDMLKQLLQGQAKGSLEMNHNASSSSPQEYAQAVTLRSGRQFPNRSSPLQIAVDIDDEEGEDLVEYADIPAPNSIELEQNPEPELDRAEETEIQKDKPELDRAEKGTDKT